MYYKSSEISRNLWIPPWICPFSDAAKGSQRESRGAEMSRGLGAGGEFFWNMVECMEAKEFDIDMMGVSLYYY